MNKCSRHLKAALPLIFLLSTSVIGCAANHSNINVLDVHFVNTQKAMFQADGFIERMHVLVELENAMFELEERNSEDEALDQQTLFSLYEINAIFELTSIAQLETDTCDLELTKIHVGFDPTWEGTPRLSYYARQIYNLIADTCITD